MATSNPIYHALQKMLSQIKTQGYINGLKLSFLSKMQLEILGAVLEKDLQNKTPGNFQLNNQEIHTITQHFEVFLKGLSKENLSTSQIEQLIPVIECLKTFLEQPQHEPSVRRRAAEMGKIWEQLVKSTAQAKSNYKP